MALAGFQTALGRLVRAHNGNDPLQGVDLDTNERAYIEAMAESAGLHFTISIQRSWCIGRATKADL
jgi:hypothetical protein